MKKSEIKILLVDDHKIVRQSIKVLLDTRGNIKVVGEAEDGRQAIEMAKRLSPDIIIMDFSMPMLNGIEASHKIKKLNPKIKIIFLTAYDNEEYMYQILKTGAYGCLLKDSAFKDLASAINIVGKGEKCFSPLILENIFKKTYMKPGSRRGRIR